MSFFDEGEEESPARAASGRASRPPRPRRGAGGSEGSGGAPDRQTLMMRRAVAGLIGLIVLIVLVLGISSCQRSAERSAQRTYTADVSSIAQDSDQSVATPFFNDLQQASAKGAFATDADINQLRLNAQTDVSRARALNVPGAMSGAQRELLLVLDFREQAVATVANQITAAMGGTNSAQAVQAIAGQMEVLLAADVIYAERVAPLIQQALGDHGIHGQSAYASHWVPSLQWLEPSTVSTALTGVAGTGSFGGAIAPGPHGHRLLGVSVGATALVAGVVNHVAGGGNPVFAVKLANVGANPETNVKVDVTVTAQGATRMGTTVVGKTVAGSSATTNVTVTGVPVGVPARVTANIGRVPGELSVVHNHQTFTAIFTP